MHDNGSYRAFAGKAGIRPDLARRKRQALENEGLGQGRTIGTARRKGRASRARCDRPATAGQPAPPQIKMPRHW
jgi:hypothetical protein